MLDSNQIELTCVSIGAGMRDGPVKKRIYVETTIVSYLTARHSRDLICAARQEITQEWWDERRALFDLYISQVVLDEAGEGDVNAAQRRLELLLGMPLLDITDDVIVLAEALINDGPLPLKAGDDAFHLALAAVHGMDFLVTWNCKHLANAQLQAALSDVLIKKGCRPPVICTPDELMENSDV